MRRVTGPPANDRGCPSHPPPGIADGSGCDADHVEVIDHQRRAGAGPRRAHERGHERVDRCHLDVRGPVADAVAYDLAGNGLGRRRGVALVADRGTVAVEAGTCAGASVSWSRHDHWLVSVSRRRWTSIGRRSRRHRPRLVPTARCHSCRLPRRGPGATGRRAVVREGPFVLGHARCPPRRFAL